METIRAMNAGLAYSELKGAWHLDRIEAMRSGRSVIPVEIQLILSDLCNHDCFFCAYRASDGLSSEQFGEKRSDGTINHNPSRMILAAKASEIIRDAASLGVKSIVFTGGGEPTVHPDHMMLFEEALDLGLSCSLNTNGDVLRPGWNEVWPRMEYVRFSVDAGTDAEYSEIRKVPSGRYEKVLRHLANLVNSCEVKESSCVVGAGYVVTPENWKNLDEGVRRIKDTGAKYVRMASMQTLRGQAAYPDDTWALAKSSVAEVSARHSSDEFAVVDLFDSAMGKRMTDPRCGFQELVAYIGANLKVYRCCYTAYTSLGEVADLAEKSLREWVTGQEKDAIYRGFDARSCLTCPLEGKNRVINYLTEPSPLHVNFI